MHCLTDEDPRFLHNGVFNFQATVEVEIVGQPCTIPDFVVEEADYRLEQNSPAIDAGTLEGAPKTDIEGTTRPCGDGVDIGAYEFECNGFIRGDTNSDADLDIADAVFTLSYLFVDGSAPTCLDSADANDDRSVDIADAIAVLGYLFAAFGDLPAPFGECGADPTGDTLDCKSYAPCEAP